MKAYLGIPDPVKPKENLLKPQANPISQVMAAARGETTEKIPVRGVRVCWMLSFSSTVHCDDEACHGFVVWCT